jgi:hypothetical protein
MLLSTNSYNLALHCECVIIHDEVVLQQKTTVSSCPCKPLTLESVGTPQPAAAVHPDLIVRPLVHPCLPVASGRSSLCTLLCAPVSSSRVGKKQHQQQQRLV